MRAMLSGDDKEEKEDDNGLFGLAVWEKRE
jgi:hypothetical protein